MDSQDIKSAFSKAVDKAKDVGSKFLDTTKELFTKMRDAIKERFDKDDEADGSDKINGKDTNVDLMMDDFDVIDDSDKYDNAIMKSMLTGSDVASRLSKEGRSPEDIERISVAVSSYSVSRDVISLNSSSSIAESEELKGLAQRVADDTGVDANTIIEEYKKSELEVNNCMQEIDKMRNGEAVDESVINSHPALRMVSSVNDVEHMKKGEFDIDSFVESKAGSAFIENYADQNASMDNDSFRQAWLVRACTPAATQAVVQETITYDARRNLEMANAAASNYEQSDDFDAGLGVD